MFFGFLSFLFKSLAILAGALPCSVHPFVIPILILIIYYMFELCTVYLVKSSLLGSSQLGGGPCLLRPALRPGSTGHCSAVVCRRDRNGPSSRILAGPVSKKIDLYVCDLSCLFSHSLSVLFLFVVQCAVVYCMLDLHHGVRPVPSSPSIKALCSGGKSSSQGTFHLSPLLWRQVLFTKDILSKSSTLETPLEALQGCTKPWVTMPYSQPCLLHDQTERNHLSPHAMGQSPQAMGQSPQAMGQSPQAMGQTNPFFLIYNQTGRYHTNSLTKLSTLEAIVSDLGLLHPLQLRKISATSLPTSTDHRRRHLTELTTLYNSSDISTVTIQDLDQLKAILPTTSDEFNLIGSSSGDVDTLLSTFNYPTNYFLYLEESQASATEDFCQKQEKMTANSYRNSLSARELGEQLLCHITIYATLANCYNKPDAILHNSTDNRVSELFDLQSLFISIRSHWHTGLTSYWRELTTPTARIYLSRDSSATHSTSDATSSSSPPTLCYTLGNNYHPNFHPTFAMPYNYGDLHDWTLFYASCQSTVMDKKELNLIQGFHCLRKAIIQHTLSLLLQLSAGTSDFRLEIMADLQEKYSRTQEFHALVCWTLNTLPGYNYTRIILSRLVHFLEETISSLKTTNPCKFDYLFILVYSLCNSKLQASWAQNTTKETAVPALSQIILPLRYLSETLHAFGAPTSVSSLQIPPRKSSNKKTDKETSFLCQQKSYACPTSALLPPLQQKSYACSTSAMSFISQQKSTSAMSHLSQQKNASAMLLLSQQKSHDCSAPTSNFNYVFLRMERHPIYLCSQKQNYITTQERRSISSGNLCHDSEEAIPPVSTTFILSQPQQLPDALLMAEEVLLQAQGDQQVETRTCSTQDAALSPSPAGSQVDRQQSIQFSQSNLPCPLSTYRQQTILSEEPDCQPPGEDSNQAVLPTLDLSQQPWKKSQNYNLSSEEAPLCPSSTSTIPTGLSSSSSDSALQNSFNSCPTPPTAKLPVLCVSTETVPETILPPAVWKKELLHPTTDRQPPQKELLELIDFTTARQPPQKELLELSNTTTNRQPPQKELFDLTDSTISKQLPQKELLNHSHLVESSTSLSPKAVDLGNLLLILFSVSSHTDWCWEFCSNLTYKEVLLQPATNYVPLVTSNHQKPADSSTTSLTEAVKKSAELCLLHQAKLHFVQSEKLSINIQRKLSSTSSRLKPWNYVLIYNQTFSAGYLPAYYCDSAWIQFYHLTLCPCGFTLSCTTGLNFMLLSDRCLSNIVDSSSHWKLQLHLQHLHTAGCSTCSSHPPASTTCYSSDPRVHLQFLQCPSTELPPETCCSWPDSKPNPDSTSEALTLYHNPEEASPGRWRSVSTEVILAHCSSRSKLLLYVSLTPISTLQPTRTAHTSPCSLQRLHSFYFAAFKGLHLVSPCSLQGLHLSSPCSLQGLHLLTLQPTGTAPTTTCSLQGLHPAPQCSPLRLPLSSQQQPIRTAISSWIL